MKHTILLILSITLLISLMACTGNTEESTQSASTTIAQKQMNMSNFSFHIASTQPVYTVGSPITLIVNLNNHTSEPMAILPWGTPLEAQFNSDMFEISKNDKTLPYMGRMIKRRQPEEKDYIKITPEKNLSATIDLSQAYAIQAPGQYTIQMKPHYLSIWSKDVENKLPKVESNSIVIEITE